MKKFIVLMLMILFSCTVFLFPNKNVRAEEDISIEELCQIYTETDEPNELSLHTYVNDFYEIVDDCEEEILAEKSFCK